MHPNSTAAGGYGKCIDQLSFMGVRMCGGYVDGGCEWMSGNGSTYSF
jgi:hypothetical protein